MAFKKWIIKSEACKKDFLSKSQELSKQFNISFLNAQILVLRGLDTKEKADDFLFKGNFSDPFLIKDMDKAVARIKKAYENNEKILICGDYDADGVTATYILYHYLQSSGYDVKYYIPERSDGYGLSKNLVKSAKNAEINLLLTVDNGISCKEEIEFAASLGIDTVVTDHHKPPKDLPECDAVIDMHRENCTSPNSAKNLCGAGVALKLVVALEGEEDYLNSYFFEYYCQVAAIGTIADIVPLTDENRFIVKNGIELLKQTDIVGLEALFKNASINLETLNSTSIAFGAVPRINAVGRMNCATDALKLLLCEDQEQADLIADEITSQNNKRKEIEQFIIQDIEEFLEKNPQIAQNRIGIFYHDDWNHGVIGIVSAKMCEKLQKPVILISIENGEARASARSYDGFNIYEALSSCSDIFIKFGGHNMAAGFSLEPDRIEEFINRIESFAKDNYKNMPLPVLNVDCQLTTDLLTIENAEQLSVLEPFGKDNPLPVFCLKNVSISDIISLSNGKYVKIRGKYENSTFDFMVFSKAYNNFEYIIGDVVDIAFEMSVNLFNGNKSLTLKVIDIIPAKFNFNLFEIGKNIYQGFKRNKEISSSNAQKIIPTYEDMANVYKYIKQNPTLCKSEEILYSRLLTYKINYCKLLIILDVLKDLNLIKNDSFGFCALNSKQKVDFKSSKTYKQIEKYTEI